LKPKGTKGRTAGKKTVETGIQRGKRREVEEKGEARGEHMRKKKKRSDSGGPESGQQWKRTEKKKTGEEDRSRAGNFKTLSNDPKMLGEGGGEAIVHHPGITELKKKKIRVPPP